MESALDVTHDLGWSAFGQDDALPHWSMFDLPEPQQYECNVANAAVYSGLGDNEIAVTNPILGHDETTMESKSQAAVFEPSNLMMTTTGAETMQKDSGDLVSGHHEMQGLQNVHATNLCGENQTHVVHPSPPTMFPLELDLKEGYTVQHDSDCSWDEKDEESIWSTNLRDLLTQFRKQDDRFTTLTPEMSAARRRKVHSMCHLMNLSHMSIPCGTLQKRVLIAKCQIQGQAWNARKERWSPGCVDPRTVVVRDFVPEHVPVGLNDGNESITAAFQRALLKARLPDAQRVWIYDRPAHSSQFFSGDSICLSFEDPKSAMEVANCIGTGGLVCGMARLGCEYLHVNDSLRDPSSMDHLNAEYEREQEEIENREFQIDLWLRPQNSRSRAQSPDHSQSSLSESSAGYSSASSAISWVDSDYGFGAKKRKRQDKVVGGYPCSADGCFMIFDRECDRRKHAAIHTEERPHVCGDCGKGFLWPKDLRRHGSRHHADAVVEDWR